MPSSIRYGSFYFLPNFTFVTLLCLLNGDVHNSLYHQNWILDLENGFLRSSVLVWFYYRSFRLPQTCLLSVILLTIHARPHVFTEYLASNYPSSSMKSEWLYFKYLLGFIIKYILVIQFTLEVCKANDYFLLFFCFFCQDFVCDPILFDGRLVFLGCSGLMAITFSTQILRSNWCMLVSGWFMSQYLCVCIIRVWLTLSN